MINPQRRRSDHTPSHGRQIILEHVAQLMICPVIFYNEGYITKVSDRPIKQTACDKLSRVNLGPASRPVKISRRRGWTAAAQFRYSAVYSSHSRDSVTLHRRIYSCHEVIAAWQTHPYTIWGVKHFFVASRSC